MSAVTAQPTRRMHNRLGYAGLIPFVLLSAIALLSTDAQITLAAVQAQIAYAALILAFLGAIHWGISLNSESDETASLVWSVVPALLAWPVMMLPPPTALALLPMLFIAAYFIDKRLIFDVDFIALRLRLTVIVVVSLVLSFLAVLRMVQ